MTLDFLTFQAPFIQGTYSLKFTHSCSIVLKRNQTHLTSMREAAKRAWHRINPIPASKLIDNYHDWKSEFRNFACRYHRPAARSDDANLFFSDHSAHGRVTDTDMLGKILERHELRVHRNGSLRLLGRRKGVSFRSEHHLDRPRRLSSSQLFAQI